MNTKTFVFDKVLLLKPFTFIMITLVAMVLLFSVATKLEPYFAMRVSLWALVGFGLFLAFFKLFSKKVIITFTDKEVSFDINGTVRTYPKDELNGFYSFNYLHNPDCTVVMDFYFSDGRVIHLYNYQFDAGKYNEDKHRMLENFLETAQQELDFRPIKISKIRTWAHTANVWFARAY
jgi:hypothetical protein